MNCSRFLILSLPLFSLLFSTNNNILGQEIRDSFNFPNYDKEYYLVLFWNVENFFDNRPDPYTSEKSFLPNGEKRWSRARFIKKRDALGKTILSIDKRVPTFIGLAEIENRYVLNQLLYETPLYMGDYGIIHKESPDRRGIDVALFYSKRDFRPLKTRFLEVITSDPLDEASPTYSRDILYVKGVLHQLDTLHIFVNHWPSKYGGERLSAPKRERAARTLSLICDSILNKNDRANILAMGDFNDTPDSKLFELLNNLVRINPSMSMGDGVTRLNKREVGTIKYEGVWEAIDHYFVSHNLLKEEEPISTDHLLCYIFKARSLLERDKKFTGYKPKRCYIGPKYNGGISDHLPILLKIKRNW